MGVEITGLLLKNQFVAPYQVFAVLENIENAGRQINIDAEKAVFDDVAP